MSNFFIHNKESLEAFTKMSLCAGARADYVQGGGGNTSVKLKDGLMAIKASGYRLADIRPNAAYAVLKYEPLRAFYNSNEPEQLEDVEKAGSEEAKASTQTIDGLAPLRPSVEAGFHSLLNTYVLHSHSVYANLAACSDECDAIAAEALAGAPYTWGVVPYVNPGARLTFAVRDELRRAEAASGIRPTVLFMRNHGLIVHHDDAERALAVHKDVNDRVAAAFGMGGDAFPIAELADIGESIYHSNTPFLLEQLKSGAYSEEFLLRKPLYPDQVVFLNGTFSFGKCPEEDHCVWDAESGVLAYNMDREKAQVVEETLLAVTFIVSTLKKANKPLSIMGEAARSFIANWESEQYRKALAGKK